MRHWAGLVFALAAGLAAGPGVADDFAYLGHASIGYNDLLGDGDDRWQTGGTTFSFLGGPEGTEALPTAPFELFELRLRGQVITPEDVAAPEAWDRPAAGVITATVNTHFQAGGYEVFGGAGLALTGPQTHAFDIQNLIHELTPADEPVMSAGVLANQIPNAFYATAHGEVSRRVQLDDYITMRPFVEGQVGVESFARVGADFFVGTGWDSGLLLRDGVTGVTHAGFAPGDRTNLSLMFGADTARVFSSALLPAARGYTAEPWRHRLRAGMQVEHGRLKVFYGAAWLSPEFAAQPTGQVVAVTQFKFRF